jgi:hypothetical protein
MSINKTWAISSRRSDFGSAIMIPNSFVNRRAVALNPQGWG